MEIENHKSFLESLISINAKEQKRKISECSDVELNIIIKCIENFDTLVLTPKEESSFKKYKKTFSIFNIIKRKQFKFIRNYLIKNQKFLKAIVGITLLKLTEYTIGCVFSST